MQLTLGPGRAPLALVTRSHRWEKDGEKPQTHKHTFFQTKGPGQTDSVIPSQPLKGAGGNTQATWPGAPQAGFLRLGQAAP